MSTTRITAADLPALLDSGAAPVYLLDEERRIAFLNTACADWLGIAAEALLGQPCNYHPPASASPLDAVVAGLCPPPQTFSGQPQVAIFRRTTADGATTLRRGHCLPLTRGDDESAPVLVILEAEDCTQEAANLAEQDTLHRAVREFFEQQRQMFVPAKLIGTHPTIVRARAQIDAAARSGARVLIVGPAGSGKDHAAQAIHYAQAEPGLLVPIDCAVMEANLVRATLRTLCARRAQRPSGSTLLLENVAELAAEAQAELLEMLHGDALHMRVVATTPVPLEERILAGSFSQELACLLGTLVIVLPPLADRIGDLPLLIQAFIEQQNVGSLRQIAGVSPEALDQLAAYPWPGNLDELTAVVRQLHGSAHGSQVTPRDLPRMIQWGAEEAAHAQRGDDAIVLEQFLANVEKELIARAMRRSKGNKSRAAKLLGLTRPRLYRRLVQLGLEPPPQPIEDSPSRE